MDRRQAYRKWQELNGLRWDKSYVKSKLSDEIRDRLEVAMLRIVQGLACARKHNLLSAVDMERAETALLDIAHASEELNGLGAKLSMEAEALKDRVEMIERHFE